MEKKKAYASGPWSLENESLGLRFDERGALTFEDRLRGKTWQSAHAGWVTLDSSNGARRYALSECQVEADVARAELRVAFRGTGQTPDSLKQDFALEISIRLQERRFEIEVRRLSSADPLISLEYPSHLLSFASGSRRAYLAIPHMQGIVIPARYDAGFMRYGQNIWDAIADVDVRWQFESGMLNMPWFGAAHGDSALLVHVLTPADCRLHVVGNAVVGEAGHVVSAKQGDVPGERRCSLAPEWMSSEGALSYARKISIELVDNGYVGMAKRYLQLAKKSGRFVTLREKIERCPAYEKLIGAPDIKIYIFTNRKDEPYYRSWSGPVLHGYQKVNTSFDQVARMVDELHGMGVERCMVLLGGWNRMGYDREHVDMWPPAEEAGGLAGLQRACDAALKRGYIFALHDNYHDLYPDAPSFDERDVIRRSDGSLFLRGVWDGGPCYVACSARQKALLERNLGKIQQHLKLNGYYFDVITAQEPYECFSEEHPATRLDDLEQRRRLFETIRDRGLVVGSERGTDWGMPVAGFYEGMQGGGTGYHRGLTYRIGLNVPLFYLVYHECVVGYWQHGTPFGREDHANHVLHDVLCAQPSSWSIDYEHWDGLKHLIKETYDLLSPLHQKLAHEPMLEHRFVSEDCRAQFTRFGDGTRIWVNYGLAERCDGDLKIPPKGFVIKHPGEPPIVGGMERRISYVTPDMTPAGVETGDEGEL